MRTLIDKRPKKSHAILDVLMKVPDNLTARQSQALADLRKLLKYELKENV